MKGLRININGEEICQALDNGSFGIILNCRNGDGNTIVNGMDKDLYAYKWHETELRPDECIVIRFEEISHISEPIEINDEFRASDEDKAKRQTKTELEAYYKLRQELIEEGLITTDE